MTHFFNVKPVDSTKYHHINTAKKILILGIESDPFSQHVMDTIYGLLPTSARVYKLGDHYRPLFPTSVLTSIEIPALKPSNTNTNTIRRQTIEIQVHDHIKQQVLEGVRKEVDKSFNGPQLVYKCIGDARLTIVHIDNPSNKATTALEFYNHSGPLQNVLIYSNNSTIHIQVIVYNI